MKLGVGEERLEERKTALSDARRWSGREWHKPMVREIQILDEGRLVY